MNDRRHQDYAEELVSVRKILKELRDENQELRIKVEQFETQKENENGTRDAQGN